VIRGAAQRRKRETQTIIFKSHLLLLAPLQSSVSLLLSLPAPTTLFMSHRLLKSLAETVTKDSFMTSDDFLPSLALASTSCEICVYTDIYPQNIKLPHLSVLAPEAMQILPSTVSI